MNEIALPLIGILINLIQVRLYLPFYLALFDRGQTRNIEFLTTAAALLLNCIAVFKKTYILIQHLPFTAEQVDILYKAADWFLVGYFFAVYIPSRIVDFLDALEETHTKK